MATDVKRIKTGRPKNY